MLTKDKVVWTPSMGLYVIRRSPCTGVDLGAIRCVYIKPENVDKKKVHQAFSCKTSAESYVEACNFFESKEMKLDRGIEFFYTHDREMFFPSMILYEVAPKQGCFGINEVDPIYDDIDTDRISLLYASRQKAIQKAMWNTLDRVCDLQKILMHEEGFQIDLLRAKFNERFFSLPFCVPPDNQ